MADNDDDGRGAAVSQTKRERRKTDLCLVKDYYALFRVLWSMNYSPSSPASTHMLVGWLLPRSTSTSSAYKLTF